MKMDAQKCSIVDERIGSAAEVHDDPSAGRLVASPAMKISLTNSLRNMGKNRASLEEKAQAADKQETKEPPMYKVLLHNDDYTTMDFVVMILETVFRKDTTEATRIMLNVHHQGMGIAGVYTREIAETKITMVHDLARKNQFPLKCSLEKVDS